MQLAHVYGYMGNMMMSAYMFPLNTERTNLSRWTCLLAGAAQNSLGRAPNHSSTDFHARNIAVFFYAHTPANWGEGLYRLSAIRIVQAFANYGEHHRNLESGPGEPIRQLRCAVKKAVRHLAMKRLHNFTSIIYTTSQSAAITRQSCALHASPSTHYIHISTQHHDLIEVQIQASFHLNRGARFRCHFPFSPLPFDGIGDRGIQNRPTICCVWLNSRPQGTISGVLAHYVTWRGGERGKRSEALKRSTTIRSQANRSSRSCTLLASDRGHAYRKNSKL